MQGCFIIIITFFRLVSVTSKEKVKARPPALNTVELMRVASSGLGMGPHHAMQIAEKLYTQGYISYPRTETTKYPENFDLLYVYLSYFYFKRENHTEYFFKIIILEAHCSSSKIVPNGVVTLKKF